jgi:hypothetical protein
MILSRRVLNAQLVLLAHSRDEGAHQIRRAPVELSTHLDADSQPPAGRFPLLVTTIRPRFGIGGSEDTLARMPPGFDILKGVRLSFVA